MTWKLKIIWSDENSVTEEGFDTLLALGKYLHREFVLAERDEFLAGTYPAFIRVEHDGGE